MVEIKSTENGFIVKGVDNAQYPYDGYLTFPANAVVIVTEDDSDMVLFKSAANFDNLFSGLLKDITIDGETMTKETIGEKFASIANKATGGGEGGGMTPEEKQELKDLRHDMENALGDIAALGYDKADKTDVYTKEQTDGKYATKDELDDLASNVPSIEGLATESYVDNAKQELQGKIDANGAKIASVEQKVDGIDLTPFATKESLETAKNDLQSQIVDCVNDAEYVKEDKKIYLKHDSMTIAEIDTTDFIKDGMVENVVVEDGFLVITFNTDSGKEEIKIGIEKIFNAENYYTKSEVDGKLYLKLDASVFNEFKNTVYTKGEADEKFLTEHQDISNLATKEEVEEKVGDVEKKIPSLDGYATEKWVEDKHYLTDHQSLDDYATKEDLDKKQDKGDYATKEELGELENKIPSTDNFATKEDLDKKQNKGDYAYNSNVVQANGGMYFAVRENEGSQFFKLYDRDNSKWITDIYSEVKSGTTICDMGTQYNGDNIESDKWSAHQQCVSQFIVYNIQTVTLSFQDFQCFQLKHITSNIWADANNIPLIGTHDAFVREWNKSDDASIFTSFYEAPVLTKDGLYDEVRSVGKAVMLEQEYAKSLVTKDKLDAKQDKGDYATKDYVDGKVDNIKGGDEHYKSEVLANADDAPVITMKNAQITHIIPDPYASTDGYNFTYYCTDNFDTTPEMVFKRTDNRYKPSWYYNDNGYNQQTLATWNDNESCFDFNTSMSHYFEGSFYASTWYVNGVVIKERDSYDFKRGSKLHLTDKWEDSDVMKIVIQSYNETWGMYLQLNEFGFEFKKNLEPFDRTDYYTINDAMEVDFRGQKYHLIPKEQLKTINGQSIVGTGNIIVTDSETKSYFSGSADSNTFYKIKGNIINDWNNGVNSYNNNVNGYFEHRDNVSATINKRAVRVVDKVNVTKKFVQKIGNGEHPYYTVWKYNIFNMNGGTLESVKPTYIKDIIVNQEGIFCQKTEYDNYGEEIGQYNVCNVTADGNITVPKNVAMDVRNSYYEFNWYESDTKDGEYTLAQLVKGDTYDTDAYVIKKGKYYKIITAQSYAVNSDYTFFNDNYFDSFLNNAILVAESVDEFEIEETAGRNNSLYFVLGSNRDRIITEGNIDEFIKGGGGDVDLSNYPTKQEVNQNYVQKEGEYVKSVTADGGAINFEKGNGTPDVVNFKTVGGQSIIGMDDIPVPTPQTSSTGTNKNYVWSEKVGYLPSNENSKRQILAAIGFAQNSEEVTASIRFWNNDATNSLKIEKATSEKAGVMSAADKNKLDATPTVWKGTQAEYDALGTYNDETVYYILED